MKPKKGTLILGNCPKLAPRLCGSFQVLARIGLMAYHVTLPTTIKFHNVFHVSLLKKYIHDCTHVIDWNLIWVEPEGKFQAKPLCILDMKKLILRN